LPGIDDRQDTDVDEAHARLADGLKACRAIVSDYRAIIAGNQADDEVGIDTAPDQDNRI